MRNLFQGFYRPTDKEFEELWNECTFSFDTNIFLELYGLLPSARDGFFKILAKCNGRIWLTYQVVFEYLAVRHDHFTAYLKPFKNFQKNLNSSLNQIENPDKYPHIDIEKFTKILKKAIEEINAEFETIKSQSPDFLVKDEIWALITDMFKGKVGDPYSGELLLDKYKLAIDRYKFKIPPGYMDDTPKNKEPGKYNDAIIWFQLLDYATNSKKPIVFVTNDAKEDWWLKSDWEKISPRPELLNEMSHKAGVQFYLYSFNKFNDYANEHFNLHGEQSVVDLMREVEQQPMQPQAEPLFYPGLARVIMQPIDFAMKYQKEEMDRIYLALGTGITNAMNMMKESYSLSYQNLPFLRKCNKCKQIYSSRFVGAGICPNCGQWASNEQDLDDTLE